MAIRTNKVKAKDYENLSDSNVAKVISALEAEQPITKKQACEMLNISYNVSRLAKIIEDYKEKKATEKRIRAEKRKSKTTIDDVSWLVQQYLIENLSVSTIAENMYWSTERVSRVLDEYAIPRRVVGETRYAFSPSKVKEVPEDAVKYEFELNELVYSMKYNCLARIKAEFTKKDYGFKVYQIYLEGDYQEYAYQPTFDLASLQHLRDLGVTI